MNRWAGGGFLPGGLRVDPVAPRRPLSQADTMAERGWRSFSATDFNHEAVTSRDEMLEMCFRNGLIPRERACLRCGQPARLDPRKRRFRCDKSVSIRKQKKQRCGWSASVFSGLRRPAARRTLPPSPSPASPEHPHSPQQHQPIR